MIPPGITYNRGLDKNSKNKLVRHSEFKKRLDLYSLYIEMG
jgi:hypothetical protein